MKIMLIEDDETKRAAILRHLEFKGIERDDIVIARSMTDFAARLSDDIGLFIIDIRVPSIDGAVASQNGPAILETIVKSGRNEALMLAISSFPEDFPTLRARFEMHGCILADFRETRSWQSTLDHLLVQLKRDVRFDFLIFCALQAERNPYIAFCCDGSRVVRGGVDCYDVQIGNKLGSVILLPKMGLVNAAVTAAICIDRYRPAIVAISGICGGFAGRAQLGQLLISEMAYEYQSGKWAADGFAQEPYQVATDHEALTSLRILAEEKDLLPQLESGFSGTRPSEQHPPAAAVFTSGSAVIADQKFMTQVEQIHRKVSALDMEVFAIQRAAQLSTRRPVCVCAKTVVDLGDGNKHDGLHRYGCHVSAKFVLKAIERLSGSMPT